MIPSASTSRARRQPQASRRMIHLPTAHQELRSLARRPRLFLTRVIWLGLLLIGLLFSGGSRIELLPPNEAARVAQTLAYLVLLAQAVGIYFLTPAVTAGILAEDRARRILTLILATPLSSLSILAGKLFARCAEVASIILIGLPVLAITSLLGGIDLVELACFEAILLVNIVYIACFSLLVGMGSRNARTPIMSVYFIWALFVIVPIILGAVGIPIPSVAPPWDAWVLALRPDAAILWISGMFAPAPRNLWQEWLLPQLAVPACLAALGFLIAVLRLRPVSASLEGAGSSRTGPVGWSGRRARATRWLEDHPIFWKEIRPARRLGRQILNFVPWCTAALSILALVGPPTIALLSSDSLDNRESVHYICTFLCAILSFLTSLAILTSALGSISGEHEKDTWVSLAAAPWASRQIVLEKACAAIWNFRAWIALILLLIVIACLARPVFVLFTPVLLLNLVADLCFCAALGLAVSTRYQSTSRALSVGLLWFCARNFAMPLACMFASVGMSSPGNLELFLILFMILCPITCQPILLSLSERPSDSSMTALLGGVISAICWLGIAALLLNMAVERVRESSASRPSSR